MVFYDFKSSALRHMQYSQLEECPRCNTSRYVTCPITGHRQNAKVMYYLPSDLYWQYLFDQPDVVSLLYNDLSCAMDPIGGLRSSGGYYRKVVENKNINADPRNQAVILSSDGMPYFKDLGCRSGWPILMRSAMLPAGLWNSPAYSHMIAFQASEYLVNDPLQAGRITRVQRYSAYSLLSVCTHNCSQFAQCEHIAICAQFTRNLCTIRAQSAHNLCIT